MSSYEHTKNTNFLNDFQWDPFTIFTRLDASRFTDSNVAIPVALDLRLDAVMYQ